MSYTPSSLRFDENTGRKKALVAMSGGVDSAVSALMAKQNGFDCLGCTMKLCPDVTVPDGSRVCCTADDAFDAKSVAARLGIPHVVFDLREQFSKEVIEPFKEAYRRGMTPNPCVDCNRFIKFGALAEKADALGREIIVTGHYARVEKTPKGFVLKKAADPEKDQSYVLCFLTQKLLSRLYLPLGELKKSRVRQIAAENGFINAEKPESQDICFVPDGDYAALVGESAPGDFVDTAGRRIGSHKGVTHYTVGQRRGLGLPADKRLYVLSVDPVSNTVKVGAENELYSASMTVSGLNWIAGEPPANEFRCGVMTRYRRREAASRVKITEGKALVFFDEPQKAIAPGQTAVFYDGDEVLGGGTISAQSAGE
ncbi:MAG: tRNA 2-thiouridine(34) synthase MnmA [Clostridia bacterium]|nr:tRNA 2-thiouridine(34) synthase MnmA [Clostridia bacterium]